MAARKISLISLERRDVPMQKDAAHQRKKSACVSVFFLSARGVRHERASCHEQPVRVLSGDYSSRVRRRRDHDAAASSGLFEFGVLDYASLQIEEAWRTARQTAICTINRDGAFLIQIL
jgi:hypothetical protein